MKQVLSTIANILLTILAIITDIIVIVVTFPVFAYGFFLGYIPEFKRKFWLSVKRTTKATFEHQHQEALNEAFAVFYQNIDRNEFEKFRKEIESK